MKLQMYYYTGKLIFCRPITYPLSLRVKKLHKHRTRFVTAKSKLSLCFSSLCFHINSAPSNKHKHLHGHKNLTLSFSCLLLLGPFHWTMVLPMSNKNTSPRLKLCQLISTWNKLKHEALFLRDSRCPKMLQNQSAAGLTSFAITLFFPLTWSSLLTS